MLGFIGELVKSSVEIITDEIIYISDTAEEIVDSLVQIDEEESK
jgi:hypothetical protein